MNRTEFVQRQHDEVRETLLKLREHAAAFEGKVPGAEDLEEWQSSLDETRSGIATLEPILADFEAVGVDPEELVRYAQTIEDWQMREAELAKKLASV